MKIKLTILFLAMAMLSTALVADPLTEEQIQAFDIKNLNSRSFDKRMTTFRIVKEQGLKDKYKKEAVAAIKRMLASRDIMQKRTGIQGENLLQYRDSEVNLLVVKNARAIEYKKGNQYFYFRQALIEYLVREMRQAQKDLASHSK